MSDIVNFFPVWLAFQNLLCYAFLIYSICIVSYINLPCWIVHNTLLEIRTMIRREKARIINYLFWLMYEWVHASELAWNDRYGIGLGALIARWIFLDLSLCPLGSVMGNLRPIFRKYSPFFVYKFNGFIIVICFCFWVVLSRSKYVTLSLP